MTIRPLFIDAKRIRKRENNESLFLNFDFARFHVSRVFPFLWHIIQIIFSLVLHLTFIFIKLYYFELSCITKSS